MRVHRFVLPVFALVLLSGCAGVTADLPTLPPGTTSPPTSAATSTFQPTPTPAPSSDPVTPGPTAPSSATPGPTAPPSPTTPPSAPPSASLDPAEAWSQMYDRTCFRVVHATFGEFVSYIEAGVALNDLFAQDPSELIDAIIITVAGANNDEPEELIYDSELFGWFGLLGLHNAGTKTIVNVRIVWQDGSTTDVTESFIERFGTDTFDVRYPQEDEFGDCDEMPELPPPG